MTNSSSFCAHLSCLRFIRKELLLVKIITFLSFFHTLSLSPHLFYFFFLQKKWGGGRPCTCPSRCIIYFQYKFQKMMMHGYLYLFLLVIFEPITLGKIFTKVIKQTPNTFFLIIFLFFISFNILL